MKKKILGILLLLFCLRADAYDSYYVPETSSLFRFDVYAPGETVMMEGIEQSSTFLIPQEYVFPLLLSAVSWSSNDLEYYG